MKVYDVPIEPFESRYSSQWQQWFAREYRENGIKFEQILPSGTLTRDIETGSFLDVHGTNWYKARQLQRIMEILKSGIVRDGDWFVFHDLWFPGLEMLAYVRDGAGPQFKIGGTLQAGSWDKHDFLVRKGMRPWAKMWEECMFTVLDAAFLSTQFHKDLIMQDYKDVPFPEEIEHKLYVTGHPIYPEDFVATEALAHKDPKLVVFPHRLDPEKCPALFDTLAGLLNSTDLKFVVSRKECKTKAAYYELLARSQYAVSFALQETWGIAMQEALFSGCIPLVPNRLSYKEMYDPALQFDSILELCEVLRQCNESPDALQRMVNITCGTHDRLAASGRNAIANMLHVMQTISEKGRLK